MFQGIVWSTSSLSVETRYTKHTYTTILFTDPQTYPGLMKSLTTHRRGSASGSPVKIGTHWCRVVSILGTSRD